MEKDEDKTSLLNTDDKLATFDNKASEAVPKQILLLMCSMKDVY